VADAELVEDVGVEDGDVGQDEVGRDELVVHVGADVAGRRLLVGPERLAVGLPQRRLDEPFQDLVDVDHGGGLPGLAARGRAGRSHLPRPERHGHEDPLPHPPSSASPR
jgi:hypothetical protein